MNLDNLVVVICNSQYVDIVPYEPSGWLVKQNKARLSVMSGVHYVAVAYGYNSFHVTACI